MAFLSSSLQIFLFVSALNLLCSSSSDNLLSLSVENPEHVIKSRNGNFTAGFYDVGENAFAFAIWLTEPDQGQSLTVIWMANRDALVNGKGSTLILRSNGNLVLNDAIRKVDVWATNTTSSTKSPELILKDDGNLVLLESPDHVLWQSFDFPTDTLVAGQKLTKHATLVSSKSQTKPSSGFYKFFFDNDNFLCLVYEGPDLSSAYWPLYWPSAEVGRSTNYTSRFAFLDSFGDFISTDHFTFKTLDYGTELQRRLVLDSDGNIRVYSRRTWEDQWYVSWEAFSAGCSIHGVCGENSFCTYIPYSGRKCVCLPGYRFKDETDWSLGCQPEFHLPCNHPEESRFLKIHKANFFRYDLGTFPNFTYDQCKDLCLNFCNCKGFQYTFDDYQFTCYPKYVLVNGNRPSTFDTDFYLKLPKSSSFGFAHELLSNTKCENLKSVKLGRQDSVLLKVLLWLALAIGGFEVVFISLVWCLTRKNSSIQHSYEYITVNVFRKYKYSELKEATRGFREEIGKGAGGIVYKGVLKDGRVAAIKKLNEANQIESEFLAEVNLIGRLNHMNLISMWGYCAEGNHRMLVYEYMENGSLAENLRSNKSLDWRKRYEIALGIARGLAYLHEECLEWVLHCDIKPQNILLDSDYKPKVADFGLSNLQNRNDVKNPSFSRIRGTRGYMAPEWVFNLPITSKVDVYSYGIVVLEMITGKSLRVNGPDQSHHGRLVTWVRDKKNKKEHMTSSSSWLEQIVDPTVEGSYEMKTMEILVTTVLQCVEEDRYARPSMSCVVEMLQRHDVDSHFE